MSDTRSQVYAALDADASLSNRALAAQIGAGLGTVSAYAREWRTDHPTPQPAAEDGATAGAVTGPPAETDETTELDDEAGDEEPAAAGELAWLDEDHNHPVFDWTLYGSGDWVRCVACQAGEMLVERGEYCCPLCGSRGTLRWVDEEETQATIV